MDGGTVTFGYMTYETSAIIFRIKLMNRCAVLLLR